MMYLIDQVDRLRPNIWMGKIPPVYLEHLKDGLIPMGPYSIVAACIHVRGNELTFSPTQAQLLCRGTSEETIFLNTEVSEYSETPSESTTEPLNEDGDERFLTACRQLVGGEFALIAKMLVSKIRLTHPGRLVEGQSRKWLNQPDNFVAMTIQNRDRSLAISIREIPEAQNSALQPKPDRPGYLRFKVSKPAHIAEALRLILASARR